jgi:D-glycero-D-manno-heptose 1,7-bisphosphate phosphatase
MFPAIFLDRDGILIEDKGCISKPSQVTFYKQTFDAVKLLSKDYKLFIVTNQSWISKGDIFFEEAAKVNNFIKNTIVGYYNTQQQFLRLKVSQPCESSLPLQ